MGFSQGHSKTKTPIWAWVLLPVAALAIGIVVWARKNKAFNTLVNDKNKAYLGWLKNE